MNPTSLLICLAILTSSFWGSWHCAAMCGPVSSLMAKRKSSLLFHSGRALSYVSIGALGGTFGSFFLNSDLTWLRAGSGIFFAILLIGYGIQTWRGKQSKIFPQLNWLHTFYTAGTPGFILGLLTVFLPCGWLYSYLLAAFSTQSASAGAVVMALFWIGGLPALSAVSLFMAKSIQVASKKQQQAAGLVLVFSGIYSLMSFYFLSH